MRGLSSGRGDGLVLEKHELADKNQRERDDQDEEHAALAAGLFLLWIAILRQVNVPFRDSGPGLTMLLQSVGELAELRTELFCIATVNGQTYFTAPSASGREFVWPQLPTCCGPRPCRGTGSNPARAKG